mgnify:FL=1
MHTLCIVACNALFGKLLFSPVVQGRADWSSSGRGARRSIDGISIIILTFSFAIAPSRVGHPAPFIFIPNVGVHTRPTLWAVVCDPLLAPFFFGCSWLRPKIVPGVARALCVFRGGRSIARAVAIIFLANVMGQRTRHLVAGTLHPLVLHLFYLLR